ncbi:thioesterase domain-containing protein [Mesorhizobium sp. VNQ89]|uniref:thioesterase domain-containing protein n=1 Tax=Mesorhizobium quangtriensis TaxID=3157709 RepID=UPI0032B8228C
MFARTDPVGRWKARTGILLRVGMLLLALFFPAQVHAAPSADVYILRGGFGVFSTGLDKLRKQLKQSGVNAALVSHEAWRSVAQKIATNQAKNGRQPVVLIGHSLGANNAVLIADALKKKGVQVDLIVSYASTAPMTVPSNVRNVLNFYFSAGGWGGLFTGGSGFSGSLNNQDMRGQSGMTHFNVDDDPNLRNQVVSTVLRYVPPATTQSN